MAAPPTKDLKTDQDVLVAFLQTPKKKQKSHVVFATSASYDARQTKAIEAFLTKNYAGYAIAYVHDAKSLIRIFSKDITLLIFDDQFEDTENSMSMIEAAKQKKGRDSFPVLYLTSNSRNLIKRYESINRTNTATKDDYCNIKTMGTPEILARVKTCLDRIMEKRKPEARFDHRVRFIHARTNSRHEGLISALTPYGCTLSSDKNVDFEKDDNILITVPTQPYFIVHEGEYFNITAKVDQVSIDGQTSKLFFNQLSAKKRSYLTRLISIVLPSRQTL